MAVISLREVIVLLSIIGRSNGFLRNTEVDSTQLEALVRRTIEASFTSFWCIQLTANYYTPDELVALLYKTSQAPMTSVTGSGCAGQIIILSCQMELAELVGGIHLTRDTRIVILSLQSLDSALSCTNIFGEAEVILANLTQVYHLEMSGTARHYRAVSSGNDMFRQKSSTLPNLMGRTLRAGTFYCPPFSYGTHVGHSGRVATANDAGSYGLARSMWTSVPRKKSILSHLRTSHNIRNIAQESLDGIEMLAFLELSKRLNFTWQLLEPSETNKWGRLDNRKWTGGVLGWLANRSIDVAFCAMWIVEEQKEIADFTVPWNQLCNTFLVPRPVRKHMWSSIALCLEPPVWVLLGLSMTLTSLVLCLITRLDRCLLSPKPPRGKSDYGRIDACFLEMLGMLVVTHSPAAERSLGPARHVICWWSLFSLLATTAYSSGLVSHLTIPPNSILLDSIKDLVQADLHWGHTYFPAVNSIFDMNNPWHRRFIKHFHQQKDPENNSLLKTGKHAVFGYKLEGTVRYFLETEKMEPKDWSTMRVMKECMSRYHIALNLAKNSPYTTAFNQGLRRLLEAGIMEKWQRDVIRRRGSIQVAAAFYENAAGMASSSPVKLRLNNLESAFILLFAGHTVAIATLFLEILRKKHSFNKIVIRI